MMDAPLIRVSPSGDGWRIHIDPPDDKWPDEFEPNEERALALARCRRFATSYEIAGHPRKKAGVR